MDVLQEVEKKQLKADRPELKPGQTVRVHQKVKEGEKERTQIFEGLILAQKNGTGARATITVRKVSSGIGVERIFPIHSPQLVKIEVVKTARARRARLYHLRDPKARPLKDMSKLKRRAK